MYWRIGPRYRQRPREDNKDDLHQLVSSGQPPGLLAFDGDVAVGWCELASRAELHWLASARYLQPVDELPVWSLPCFYVRRVHRHAGISGALSEAALAVAAAAGAPASTASGTPVTFCGLPALAGVAREWNHCPLQHLPSSLHTF